MRLLSRLEKRSRKSNRTLWPISPPSSLSSLSSSSSPSPSPFLSQSSSSDSPTSPPSSPPSPPSPMSYFDPLEAPKSPMFWTWTCHICNHNWRMGTTSRCLNCSHRMCMPEEPKLSSSSSSSRRKKSNSPTTDSSSSYPLSSLLSTEQQPDIRRRPMLPLKHGAELDRHRYYQYLKRHFRRSRIRQDRKRKIKYCRSQFDYSGWEDWNEWRRDVKQFNTLRRRYEEPSENGDESDDTETTLDFESDEAEEEDGDTFKLVPATGRLHVVASSSPVARKEAKEPPERSCLDDCDFPAHCMYVRDERKRRETSLNRVFL